MGIIQSRVGFGVENPLIWARYVRVELLTHYGMEYYCPISLFRVHGTTMMEEFKNQEEAAKGDEEVEEDVAETDPTGEALKDELPGEPSQTSSSQTSMTEKETEEVPVNTSQTVDMPETDPGKGSEAVYNSSTVAEVPPATHTGKALQTFSPHLFAFNITRAQAREPDNAASVTASGRVSAGVTNTTSAQAQTTTVVSLSTNSSTSANTNGTSNSTSAPHSSGNQNAATTSRGSASKSAAQPSQEVNKTSSTSTQPPAANPTTQESFFKTIHKRLQLLEANATLSLQYIEEQSQILRDAFAKVEKRQLAKTTAFLQELNATVFAELRGLVSSLPHKILLQRC